MPEDFLSLVRSFKLEGSPSAGLLAGSDEDVHFLIHVAVLEKDKGT